MGYHHAQLVKQMAFFLNIELHYLPPYRPNLNMAERLWKFINQQVCNNYCFPNLKVFRKVPHHFLNVTLREKRINLFVG
ncbi:transposase [Xenorhabdus vietnamensis]|uniref:transposase n=1 Tax=Xenorhabdus vietnamensis TaxID=351656 RepID=UPI003BB660D6